MKFLTRHKNGSLNTHKQIEELLNNDYYKKFFLQKVTEKLAERMAESIRIDLDDDDPKFIIELIENEYMPSKGKNEGSNKTAKGK